MKNASSLKSKNNIESPKTPGGISKSLLTPCRRLGLSRKWKNSGPSPFVSPLASTNSNVTEPKQESESRKRKKCSPEKETDNIEVNRRTHDANVSTPASTILQISEDSSNTPKRLNLHRKKSKTLLMTSENLDNNKEILGESHGQEIKNPTVTTNLKTQIDDKPVQKLFRVSSTIKINTQKSSGMVGDKGTQFKNKSNENKDPVKMPLNKEPEHTSPNNLTKECIVVIQKKMLKSSQNKHKIPDSKKNESSQVLFDSDSDDVPLCQINKNDKINQQKTTVLNNNCAVNVTEKIILSTQLENKHSENSSKVQSKSKVVRNKPNQSSIESKHVSQSSNSFDDDDDFDLNPKKTIMIKKTYNKVTRPTKAKSTGSITDRDIEDIKARIEAKKKILLTKAINPETEDLRGLIKKWQRGCQDALMELMELMKKRMPDQNVENSEILQMLKIPPDLVGYDSENDCFHTPDDERIILSSFNIS